MGTYFSAISNSTITWLGAHIRKNFKLVATGNPEQVMLGRQNQAFFETVKTSLTYYFQMGGNCPNKQNTCRKIEAICNSERIAGVSVVEELLKNLMLVMVQSCWLVVGGMKVWTLLLAQNNGSLFQRMNRQIKNLAKKWAEVLKQNQAFLALWLPRRSEAHRGRGSWGRTRATETKAKAGFVSLGAPSKSFGRLRIGNCYSNLVFEWYWWSGAPSICSLASFLVPLLVRQLKLEWFWRLIQEPSLAA